VSSAAILAALAAAASWAFASIAISRLLEHGHVSPAAANLFKNGLAAFCFFIAALALGGRWPVGEAWGWLFVSGFLGFTLADSLYFGAFRRCGVQTAATVMLLNVPIATVLSVPLAGDEIQTQILPFMAVVLIGVILVIIDSRLGRGGDPSGSSARTKYWFGVLLAVVAACAIGTAVPIGRGRFDEVGVWPGGFIRLLGGALGAFPVAMLVGLRRGSSATAEIGRLIQPLFVAPGNGSVWGRASLIGVGFAIVGLMPYHYALRELPGGISAVLFSTTPLFTLPLAMLVGQRAGLIGVIGTIIGFAGVAGILLGDEHDHSLSNFGLEVTRITVPGPTSARFPTFVVDGRGMQEDWGMQTAAFSADRDVVPPLIATADSTRASDDSKRIVLLGDRGPSARLDRTVVEGVEFETAERGPFFVNWADVPRAARTATGALLVATLERLGDSTYAYGVNLLLEEDGPPGRALGWLHEDRAPVEHGFVSLVPEFDGGVLAVWLDARKVGREREIPAEGERPTVEGMHLYSRSIRADGSLLAETELDHLVCDCCPTDAVELKDRTIIVVYRDRTAEEIRDIWFVRRPPGGAEWSEPAPVHVDGWEFAACPVNGPAIAVSDGVVAVAWYTQAGEDDEHRVRVAFSLDGAQSFGPPIDVEVGPTLGRVDLADAGGGRFVLTQLMERENAESLGDGASWTATLVAPGEIPAAGTLIADVDAQRRSGRLDLVSSPVGPVYAIWTSGLGLEAARIDVVRLAGDGPDNLSE